jgi:hypothetical protein
VKLTAIAALANAVGALTNDGAGNFSYVVAAGTGTVTSVTAGNGMTQSGVATVNPTLDVVSHAGSAGTIGTLAVGANDLGVSLGNTSTTACSGADARLSDARTPSNDANIVHISGTETITGAKTFNLDIKNPIAGVPIAVSNPYYNGTNNTDAFCQFHITNKSGTSNASTDFIATADNGTDTTNYVNLGINGSAYSVGTWTINGAGDSYEYAQSGNHAVGTATAGKNLVLFTGGTLAANARLTLSDTLATFSTPVTGGAYNKVIITAPLTAATLTLANGSIMTTSGPFSYQFTIPGNFTYTYPGQTDTLAGLGGTNTWTAAQTFSSTINKVTITAPATSATLTLVTGSTLQTTGAFTLNLTTTAASTPTFPTGAGTLPYLAGTNTWTGGQTFNTVAATFALTDVHTLGIVCSASAAVATLGYFGYDSTQKTHGFYESGIKTFNTGTIFTQTATGTNGAATAITNILGTGVGTAVLPASHSLIGKTIRLRTWGTVTTAAAPGTTVISFRLNAATPVVLVASPSQTLAVSMTNMPFMIEADFTYITTTTVSPHMTMHLPTANTGLAFADFVVVPSAVVTIVAATSYTIEIDSTNGTASGTIYTTRGSSIEVLS